MTLPVPSQRTWTTGETVSAAMLNGNVRDAVNYLLGQPSFTVYMATQVSIPNSTLTTLHYDTVAEDNYSGWLGGLYTIPSGQGGRWLFTATMQWFTSTTGSRYLEIVANSITAWQTCSAATDGGLGRTTVSWLGRLAAGQNAAVNVFQSAGASLYTATGQANIQFSGQRLGS